MFKFREIQPPEHSPSLKIIQMDLIENNTIIYFKCLIDEKEHIFNIERKGASGVVLPAEIIDIITETLERSRQFGTVLEDFFSGNKIIYPIGI